MQKILIIRFSSIGDIILTTPCARWLKLQLNAEVHFLTNPSFVKILEPNIYIDKVIPCEKKHNQTIQTLKLEKYDLVIDLHKSRKSTLFRWKLGVKSFAFDKLNLEKWLLVNCKVDNLPNIHLVDRYANAMNKIGIVNDGQGLDFFIPEETSMPESLPQIYSVIVLGAAHATKRIPQNKVVEIISNQRGPYVLIGGADVIEEAKEIMNLSKSEVTNLCGSLSIFESALVMKNARKIITGDTGMMHIAAALDKNLEVYWGNTVPKFGMYPYFKDNSQAKAIFKEVVDLPCRPCSKIGFDKCPKGHFKCMNDQITTS